MPPNPVRISIMYLLNVILQGYPSCYEAHVPIHVRAQVQFEHNHDGGYLGKSSGGEKPPRGGPGGRIPPHGGPGGGKPPHGGSGGGRPPHGGPGGRKPPHGGPGGGKPPHGGPGGGKPPHGGPGGGKPPHGGPGGGKPHGPHGGPHRHHGKYDSCRAPICIGIGKGRGHCAPPPRPPLLDKIYCVLHNFH